FNGDGLSDLAWFYSGSNGLILRLCINEKGVTSD
ncbi:unnamed protein product, partial [marine sediment metagenome]